MSWIFERFADAASSTLLSTGTDAGSTVIQVSNAATFPPKPNFRIIIDSEKLLVTAISGTMYTVTRGIEGSSPAAHAFGTPVSQVLTKTGLFSLFEISGLCQSTLTASSTSTVSLLPSNGDRVALWDVDHWRVCAIPAGGIALAIPNNASACFDIFAYITGANVVGLTYNQWTNTATRGVALTTQDGVYIQSGQPTSRYIGTILTTAAGTVVDTPSQRFVWNVQNRTSKTVLVPSGISTSGFVATTQPIFAGSMFEFVAGLPAISLVSLNGSLMEIGDNTSGLFKLGFLLNRASTGGLTALDAPFYATANATSAGPISTDYVFQPATAGYGFVRMAYFSGFAGTLQGAGAGITGFLEA